MTNDSSPPSTFQSIFFNENTSKTVRVPDYQRAFAWEEKQINLFIEDLEKYKRRPGDYYFGHYIVENTNDGWDLVDGQQRITTFVLFLMTCRLLSPNANLGFSLIDRFLTVSYDNENLKAIGNHLAGLSELSKDRDLKLDIPDKDIIKAFPVDGHKLTRSLKRVVWSLLRFHQAFAKGVLKEADIEGYIGVVMNANCSHHIAKTKSVAVNVFEMHNTRGIRLTTIEIVKAKLMQFVYDNGGEQREKKVKEIQDNFGAIFRMEESLAAQTFRGELSLEDLLLLHLRVVDDASKAKKQDFHSPAENADVDAIVKYLDNRMNWVDPEKKTQKSPEVGVRYALEMTEEFKKSVQIASEFLPAWDNEEGSSIVGDVLIFEKDLSCQFFLLACRHFELEEGKANGRADIETIALWEKLLFTRDFHEEYYNLKGGRDDFQGLFAEFFQENAVMKDVISKYLKNGFRSDKTKNLQKIVRNHLSNKKNEILTNAYNWWKHKLIYVIYKYEKVNGAEIRKVVKGKISVEHIFPQTWDWMKKDLQDKNDALKDEVVWQEFQGSIDACKHGIGNLLLITPNENTSEGNNHPKDKYYDRLCNGGSYEEHNNNRGRWEDRNEWKPIIEHRGQKIYDFMIDHLIGASDTVDESLINTRGNSSE